jgi:hypothetical protein
MISKELLSEILGRDVKEVGRNQNNIWYKFHPGGNEMNIYEVVHKCKEWAFNKGYIIDSAFVPKGNFTSSYAIIRDRTQAMDTYKHRVNADTEAEAVVQDCEWILKIEQEVKDV